MLVLGIETSCDETSAAVVEDGRRILSNLVASQVATHSPFGGVVPELASRQHLSKIGPIVDGALKKAGVGLDAIEGIAVTQGPGLIGSLLVGLSFGKAIAYARKIPIVAVDHLEGHIRAVYIESPEEIPHPAVSLVVSGGHTSLFLMEEESRYRLLGKTRDDAAGEAYDKVAKRLGLGYPGGPILDKLAALGDAKTHPFTVAKFSDGSEDFSFSGLKTAVLRAIQEHGIEPLGEGEDAASRKDLCDLAASFQRTVVKSLVERTRHAVKRHRARAVLVSGGVAANRELRATFEKTSERLGVPVLFPSLSLSTDNAAMIAAAGYLKLLRGETSGLDLNANVELRLGEEGARRSRQYL
ncbi:MAG TPA: tRNA (adenosine(37)-N6)-threonylcarbamoyltransferase complex transferase subunit TsaD [Vicinamibacteria bacterium]|nr:tRNA (adenosine(37)-N6)-threonylcarbamoyltransferase complex transferase subunit TsaD [Vicinamibacteria bacterium]